METTDPGQRDDLPLARRLERARDGRIAVEAHVWPVFVVVAGIRAHQAKQMTRS